MHELGWKLADRLITDPLDQRLVARQSHSKLGDLSAFNLAFNPTTASGLGSRNFAVTTAPCQRSTNNC